MFKIFRRTPLIESPTIGFYDLTRDGSAKIIAADKAALVQFFISSVESTDAPPTCDVLFVYCYFEPSGRIRGSSRSLREMIRDSGAAVVVIATENSGNYYMAAAKEKENYGQANLVMVLCRKGDIFAKFFQRLFGEMKRGVSMPVAWDKLAPQIPGAKHADCPDAIFACEKGQLAFK
jgi:hypothetical protein